MPMLTPSSSSQLASSSSSPPMTIKGIIFDLDGTLIDSWKLGYDATNTVLLKNDISPISPETYHDGTRFTTPERLARHAGLSPPPPTTIDQAQSEFHLVGNRLAEEFDNLYIDLVDTQTAPLYPGISDMIQSILLQTSSPPHNSIKLGLFTNACKRYADTVLQKNPTSIPPHAFSVVHGADTVPKPKPHPHGLWQCCSEMGELDPKDCIYVGDSPGDGLAAKAAGLGLAVGVTWGSHGRDSLKKGKFDVICESVGELNDVLLGQF